MNCPICEKEMIIIQNTSYDDMGMDSGDGYVHDYVCQNNECNCESVLVFEKIENATM